VSRACPSAHRDAESAGEKNSHGARFCLAFYFCWCSFSWFQLLFLEDENDHD
jgi:hypothetical protein